MPPSPASDPLGQRLSRLVPDLDRLVADAEARDAAPGRNAHQQLHDLEERARALADAIVAPFRKPTAAVNPPLAIQQLPNGGVRAIY